MQKQLIIFIVILFASPLIKAQELDEILGAEEDQSIQIEDEKIENLELQKINELSELVPFDDVAVIQRRYLPRTGRFEIFPNFGLIVNDAFFQNFVAGGRFAYGLSERWAIEVTGSFISRSEKDATKDLEEVQVTTTSLVVPKSYVGADIRWSPIYGKTAFFSDSIVPFDMYFSLGGGSISTNQDDSPFAFHFGTGQSYAISKSWAFRWDLSFYSYTSTSSLAGATEGRFNNLHLTLGFSFFFPEAKYR